MVLLEWTEGRTNHAQGVFYNDTVFRDVEAANIHELRKLKWTKHNGRKTWTTIGRRGHQRCSIKKTVLKIFVIFKENTCVGVLETSVGILECWSLCWVFLIASLRDIWVLLIINYKMITMKQLFADILQSRCSLKFRNIYRKRPCWNLCSIKLKAWRPVTWLKRYSNSGVFLWILQNF